MESLMDENDVDFVENDSKSHWLKVRINERELQDLRFLSEITGKNMSDIVRIGIAKFKEEVFSDPKNL